MSMAQTNSARRYPMHKLLTLPLMAAHLAVLGWAQTVTFNNVLSNPVGTPNTNQTLTVGNGTALTATGTGQIYANYTSTGGVLVPVSTRLQTSGYAYPDFCAAPDGASPDTTCLGSALTALGTNFAVLEIPAAGSTTSNNYVCTSLGTTWAAAQSRVHIWKGAALSCALPPADGTHIIQDDNLAPINPWPSAVQPSTIGPGVYICLSSCSTGNDLILTPSGTYTGMTPLTYGVAISSTGTPDSFSWGTSVDGSNFTSGSPGTQITQGIATVTAATGGTQPAGGLCTLSFSPAGAAYFTVGSGTFTVTAPGYGFTSTTTSATLGGQCSGTATMVTITLTTGSGLIPLSNGVYASFPAVTGHHVSNCPTTTYTGDCWTALATSAITSPGNINNAIIDSWCVGSFSGGTAGNIYGLVPGAQVVTCAGTLISSSPPNTMPFACTARNLQVRLGSPPGSGDTDTITLYHNGAQSTLKCTISGSTAVTCSDTNLVDAVSFAAGDRWVVGYTLGTSTAATNARVSFQCQ